MASSNCDSPSRASRIARLLLLGGGIGLLLVAWRGQYAFQYGRPRANGGWVLVAAIGLLVLVGAVARRMSGRQVSAPHPDPHPLPSVDRLRTVPGTGSREGVTLADWLAVAALCVVGIIFRTIHFDTIPPGLNHDAAWYGMYAIQITQGAPYTPYISAAWGRETLFMYLIAPLLVFMGNTPEAIQLASTLCGIAALVPLYVLVRLMFDRRVALLALAFLAVSGWHGVFSRAGWRVITVPPFEILALYGAWRALQTPFIRHWVLMGAGSALSIYTYNSARIVPFIVGAYYLLSFPRQRARRGSYLRGGLIALVTFVIVGGPMLWYAAHHFQEFQGRAEFLLQEREQQLSLVSNWIAALGLFNYRGNGDDFFVDEPLLEPMAAVLFVIGLVAALWQITRREHLFLLVGLLISLLPGVLTSPNGNRGITAVAFVYPLIGLGLARFADGCAALLGPGRGRHGLAGAIVGLAVAVAAVESYQEFLGPNRRSIYGFYPTATAVGEFMRGRLDTHRVYTIAGNWPENTLIYLSHGGAESPYERRWVYGQTLDQVEPEINRYGTKGLLFLLDRGAAGTSALDRLEKRFAEHRIEPVTARRAGGKAVATAFFVEPEALSKSGLWGNYTRSLFVHDKAGAPPHAAAVRCAAPVGGADGVSLRLRLMMPVIGRPMPVGEVRFLRDCPPEGKPPPLLTVAMSPAGVVAIADHAEVLVPWARLEAGRWYEIFATIPAADRAPRVVVDGTSLSPSKPFRVDPKLPVGIGGIQVLAEHVRDPGGHFYLDDLAVVGGVIEPADPRWVPEKRPPGTLAMDETFEIRPFGQLAESDGWRDVKGAVTVANSPAFWRSGGGAQGENAFDGLRGEGPGQFNEPTGVAVDAMGNFFVAERANNRIQKFAPDGTYLTTWGRQGSGPGEFREPMDVAADDQFLYVADTWNHRVQVFDWDGNFIFQITGDPTFSSPRGIYARHGRLYLADSGRGIVRVFERSGKSMLTIGQSGGSEPGHLVEAVDVVADSHGRVYVVNSGNSRIEIFAADGASAGSFPVSGWEGPQLKEGYLWVDSQNILYLSDPGSGRVRRFQTSGAELEAVGPKLDTPSGMGLSGERLIVSARRNHGVRAILLGPAAVAQQ